jgi:hypothetical protein
MTEPNPMPPTEQDLTDLAALADGSLPEGRRAALEARVARSPELAAELEDQRRALAAIRATNAELGAPERLRERITEAGGGSEAASTAAAGRTPARPPWWRRWPALATAGAVAAAAVVALVVVPGGEPTVVEAAQLAELPPAEPAPEAQAGDPALLATNFEGLSYPDWAAEFGWRAAGVRTDELDGRTTKTVFYEKDGRRIGYTIVSGDALAAPDGGERSVVDGVELDAFGSGEANAVTWLRDGRSCVLAGDDVDRATLLELAAWKGDGAVAF